MEDNSMKHSKPRGKIEIHVQGAQIIIYEHYSSGSADQVLKKAKAEYGIELQRKGYSKWCG